MPDSITEIAIKGEVLECTRRAELPILQVRGIDAFHACQAIRAPGAQIVENHLANHTEDSHIGADSQRERTDCHGCEPRSFSKAAHGLTEVGQKGLHLEK